jgi:hypothetical protein
MHPGADHGPFSMEPHLLFSSPPSRKSVGRGSDVHLFEEIFWDCRCLLSHEGEVK